MLEPLGATGAASGYFLYDFLVNYGYITPPFDMPYKPTLLVGSVNKTTGYMNEVTEGIMPTPPKGAGGTGKLVTLWFKSLNQTAYSPIKISLYQDDEWQPMYKDATPKWYAAAAIDGHYNEPPVHDVAVTDVSAPAEATQGDDITIDVDVTNLGGYDETFNVTVRYDSEVIDTKPVTLVLGGSTTIPFSWETASVSPKTYTITAEAILAGDADLTSNEDTTTVLIKPPPGAIAGTVTDASTDLPIDGASITANSYTTTTDEYGNYTIADVPPGDYTVEASATGYHSDSKPAHVESGEPATVDFTLTPVVHDIAIINVVPPSTTEVFVGDAVDITVIVKNEGNVEESFTINVYAGVDLVETKTAALAVGATGTYTFTWTTTAVGNFTINAEVPPVLGEDDTDDNTWTTTLWRIQVIPEFPTLIPLLLTLAILAVSTIILKRRTQKTINKQT